MNLSESTSPRKAKKTHRPTENWLPAPFQVPLPKPAHIHCKVPLPSMIHQVSVCLMLILLDSDVLRRRFQINTMTGMGYQYKSIWDAIKIILKHEGIRGLYKGIVPNLMKVAPSMASSWLSFEVTRDFLVGLREKNID